MCNFWLWGHATAITCNLILQGCRDRRGGYALGYAYKWYVYHTSLLHPNLATIYKEKIANLVQSLNDPNNLIEANAAIRQLIERVQLVPENGELKIELYGELAALLKLGTEPLVLAKIRKTNWKNLEIFEANIQLPFLINTSWTQISYCNYHGMFQTNPGCLDLLLVFHRGKLRSQMRLSVWISFDWALHNQTGVMEEPKAALADFACQQCNPSWLVFYQNCKR